MFVLELGLQAHMVEHDAMPLTAIRELQRDCVISSSQEELLNNIPGWDEPSKGCSLDETPSQPLMNLSSHPGSRSQSESESSEDFNTIGVYREAVEFVSPPSSSQSKGTYSEMEPLTRKTEGRLEKADEVNATHSQVDPLSKRKDGVEIEDSYNAAFESDRSGSPTHSGSQSSGEQGFEGHITMDSMSAQPITQPPFDEFVETQTQAVMSEWGLAHPANPTAAKKGREQPTTQPTADERATAQPSIRILVTHEERAVQPVLHSAVSESATRVRDIPRVRDEGEDTNEGEMTTLTHLQVVSPSPPVAIKGINVEVDVEHLTMWLTQEPDVRVHCEREIEEAVPSGGCLRNERKKRVASLSMRTGKESVQRKGSTGLEMEHTTIHLMEQLDHMRERAEAGSSTQLPDLNRVARDGRGEVHRTEASQMRVPHFPKTVMDVVRLNSSPIAHTPGADTCDILSVAIRAGMSFPPIFQRNYPL